MEIAEEKTGLKDTEGKLGSKQLSAWSGASLLGSEVYCTAEVLSGSGIRTVEAESCINLELECSQETE